MINHRDLSCCSLLIHCHKCNISLCHLKKQPLQSCQCHGKECRGSHFSFWQNLMKNCIFFRDLSFPNTSVASSSHSSLSPTGLMIQRCHDGCGVNKQRCSFDGCVSCYLRPVAKSGMER